MTKPSVHSLYFDRISSEQAKDLFPEISHKKLPKVDMIGDLDDEGLEQIPSESFEFIIMNHVLDHLFDPIQVIKESLRILKPGGSLVMSVPDKRFTFDSERTAKERALFRLRCITCQSS